MESDNSEEQLWEFVPNLKQPREAPGQTFLGKEV
jgi:hypothetical protein